MASLSGGANQLELEDLLLELDIDEDLPIEIVRDHDDFESTEVLFSDDLDLDSLDEATLKLLDGGLPVLEIPTPPTNVADDDSAIEATTSSKNTEGTASDNGQKIMKCPYCSKPYKRKKHKLMCGTCFKKKLFCFIFS